MISGILKKIEEYMLNLIKEGRKETLEEMSINIGIKYFTLSTYIYKHKGIKKLYQKCKMRGSQKNVSSIIDKWESGRFDKIQVSDINLSEEEGLKKDIISFLEENDNITKDDILNKFDITIGKINSLKSRDYDFMKKFNKLSKTRTYVIEEKIRNILDKTEEKKTIKEIENEIDGVSALHIYAFLRKNKEYNEKIFRRGKKEWKK